MLELKDISFTIPKDDDEIALIDQATLKVPAGHFMAIVGPSGCGKSTLLKLIAGINIETDGNLYWNGRDLSEEGDIEPAELGYVPQFSIAYEHLTVEESIESAIRLRVVTHGRGAFHDLVDRVLDQAGMDAIRNRPVSVFVRWPAAPPVTGAGTGDRSDVVALRRSDQRPSIRNPSRRSSNCSTNCPVATNASSSMSPTASPTSISTIQCWCCTRDASSTTANHVRWNIISASVKPRTSIPGSPSVPAKTGTPRGKNIAKTTTKPSKRPLMPAKAPPPNRSRNRTPPLTRNSTTITMSVMTPMTTATSSKSLRRQAFCAS